MILRAEGLTQSYGSRALFGNLSLTLNKGEFLTVLGPSGCGKSTLLRLFAGLEDPHQGHIERLSGAGHAAIVFQEPRLLPWLTVNENIALPLSLSHIQNPQKIPELLQKLRLKNDVGQLFPHELSGGMKMRVALARAFVQNPGILFLDEPFSALDEQTRARLQDELLEMKKTTPDLSCLFISHSMTESVFLSDRILILNSDGCLVHEWLRPAGLSANPQIRDQPEYFTECRNLSHIFQKLTAVNAQQGLL